jgi:hypothetical protein
MPGGFTMPVNPSALASTYAGSSSMMPSNNMGANNMGMTGGGSMGMMPSMGMGGSYPSYPSTGSSSSLMPTVDLRRVVWQGVQGLPSQQQQNGAMAMANQNLNQLNQGMSNSMSPVYQMRNNIRNQIMGNRISDISRMGQSMFMPMVQPGAIQSMIRQIQPWNFPSRFQSAMMPNMAPYVSQSIIPRQMAYMQQGIMNNPNFPFPSSSMGGYSGGMGGYNNGMSSSGYGMMMPSNSMGMSSSYGMSSNSMMPSMGMMPNMPNMGGMMMPSNSMGMSGGGYGMMPYNGMMPGMGMGMGMMPNMGMMAYPSYY